MDKMNLLLRRHNEWRGSCVNLIASENVMSATCEKLYVSDLMHRYAEGVPGKRYYQGLKYIDEIEILVQKRLKIILARVSATRGRFRERWPTTRRLPRFLRAATRFCRWEWSMAPMFPTKKRARRERWDCRWNGWNITMMAR